MLTYYHGTEGMYIHPIFSTGATVSRGGGELGQGFYVGSSMWRAFSWAWQKANKNGHSFYGVIEYQIDEVGLFNLNLLCKNRASTELRYAILKQTNTENSWNSHHDAIWAPIVGRGVKDAYQIKFESILGETFINQQNKSILWP